MAIDDCILTRTEDELVNKPLIPKYAQNIFEKNYDYLIGDTEEINLIKKIIKEKLSDLENIDNQSSQDIKRFTKIAHNLYKHNQIKYSLSEKLRLIHYHNAGINKPYEETINLKDHLKIHRLHLFYDLENKHRKELSINERKRIKKTIVEEYISILTENCKKIQEKDNHSIYMNQILIGNIDYCSRLMKKNIITATEKILLNKYKQTTKIRAKIGLKYSLGVLAKLKFSENDNEDIHKESFKIWKKNILKTYNYYNKIKVKDINDDKKYKIKIEKNCLYNLIMINHAYIEGKTKNTNDYRHNYDFVKKTLKKIKKYQNEYKKLEKECEKKDLLVEESINSIVSFIQQDLCGLKNEIQKSIRKDETHIFKKSKKKIHKRSISYAKYSYINT